MLSLVIALGVAGQRPSIRGPGLQEGCAPQKACDFVVGIHAQCISTDPWPPHPIPGAPGCKPIALLCTPEENCVLDSVNFQDNITTEGVERLVTLTNVVIQNTIGYGNTLVEVGEWGKFKGTNLTFRNIPTSTATYPGSCVGNNFGSFSCENCTFENCTNIGPGGAVYSGKDAELVLINPIFKDCKGGWIPAAGLHKPGFGDGCYCETADASKCLGCTCQKGTAGNEPGFYCDST